MVLMRRWARPSSPTAFRAELMRLVSVDFGNDTTVPNGGDDVVFCNNPLSIADKVLQKIENLRFDGNRLARLCQFSALRIELECLEAIEHGPSCRRSSRNRKTIWLPLRSRRIRIKLIWRLGQGEVKARTPTKGHHVSGRSTRLE